MHTSELRDLASRECAQWVRALSAAMRDFERLGPWQTRAISEADLSQRLSGVGSDGGLPSPLDDSDVEPEPAVIECAVPPRKEAESGLETSAEPERPLAPKPKARAESDQVQE